jgi:hypothetical protein
VYAAFFILVAIAALFAGELVFVADQVGLLWIAVLSGIAAVLLISMAYLPVRA